MPSVFFYYERGETSYLSQTPGLLRGAGEERLMAGGEEEDMRPGEERGGRTASTLAGVV